MSIHYYLGWFNDLLTDKVKKALQEDIKECTSLVMITANTSRPEVEVIGECEQAWLKDAGLIFEEVHLIDHNTEKEAAKKLIEEASVVFLLGGYVLEQNQLLKDKDLMASIKKAKAITLGTSAGAINMSSKWLYSAFTDQVDQEATLYEGIGFDDFSVLSHHDLENTMDHLQAEMAPILKEMKLYASNKDCAIRVADGQIDILGEVYLVTRQEIKKLAETM